MLDLQYWAGLALKVGQHKPELMASLEETKSQVKFTEAKILKYRRKLGLMVTNDEADIYKLLNIEERLTDLTSAMVDYRRELVQKSLDYVTEFFEATNRQLTEADATLDVKLLKRLVLLAKDALKRIGAPLASPEIDVRLFLSLKNSLQEYLNLIVKRIKNAGVTARDLESLSLQPCSN